jgi:hypothetical protein
MMIATWRGDDDVTGTSRVELVNLERAERLGGTMRDGAG